MSTELWRAAARVLLGALVLGAALAAGLWLGAGSVQQEWRADIKVRSAAEAARARATAAQYVQHAASAVQVAEAVLADQVQLQARNDSLTQELAHARHSLIAAAPRADRLVGPPGRHLAPAAQRQSGASLDPGPIAAGAALPGAPDRRGDRCPDLGADPGLSRHAVSLWNRALGIAAGASGPIAPDPRHPDGAASGPYSTDPADTEPSGITLSDAWSNHIANASSCAFDRVRLRALQGLLQQTMFTEGLTP
jgi:hypothetical protein